MVIFINDKPIEVLSSKQWEEKGKKAKIQTVFDCKEIKSLPLILNGSVVFIHINSKTIISLFEQIYENKNACFQSIILVADDKEIVENTIKAQFKVITAAGGVVRKEGKILLMYRLGKWDFPKGKRDNGENSRQTAVREVQEECNIEVELGEKICTTWHTYSHKGNRILKRTKWYEMLCNDDSNMQPQTEEGIELLEWKTKQELAICMKDTYQSIRYVAEQAGLI
jgi:8-oxo-(d)GTP phosphatase